MRVYSGNTPEQHPASWTARHAGQINSRIGQRTGIALAKSDYLPDNFTRCNRVAETTPNVKRYITVRFDEWNQMNDARYIPPRRWRDRTPRRWRDRLAIRWLGLAVVGDGRYCVGRVRTDLLARVTDVMRRSSWTPTTRALRRGSNRLPRSRPLWRAG